MIRIIKTSFLAIFFIPMLLFFLHPGQAKAWPTAINVFTRYVDPLSPSGGGNVIDVPVSYESGKSWEGRQPNVTGAPSPYFSLDIGAYPIVGGAHGINNGVRTCRKDLCEECRDGHRGDLPGNPPCVTDKPSWVAADLPDMRAVPFTCNPDNDPDSIPSGQQTCPGGPACKDSGSQAAAFIHATQNSCTYNSDFVDASGNSTIDKLFWSLFKIPYNGNGYTVDPGNFPLTSNQQSCTGVDGVPGGRHANDGGWTTISGSMGNSFNCACSPLRVTIDLRGRPYKVKKIEKQVPLTDGRMSSRLNIPFNVPGSGLTCNGADHKCTVDITEAPNGELTNIYFTLESRTPEADPSCDLKVKKGGVEVSSANQGDTTCLEWHTQHTSSAVYKAYDPSGNNYYTLPNASSPSISLPNGFICSLKNIAGMYNFNMDVTNSEGVTKSCPAQLNVLPVPTPGCALTVTPSSHTVTVGDPVKIGWSSHDGNFSNFKLTRTDTATGSATDMMLDTITSNPISFLPTKDTTYSLTAQKDGIGTPYNCGSIPVTVKPKNTGSARPVAP